MLNFSCQFSGLVSTGFHIDKRDLVPINKNIKKTTLDTFYTHELEKKWLKNIERIKSKNVTTQLKYIVTQIGPEFLHVDKMSDFPLI